MENYIITEKAIQDFAQSLKALEYAVGSIEKYIRDIHAFKVWSKNTAIKKELLIQWKTYLLSEGYQAKTINSMISSLNSFFKFRGWPEFRMKYLKIQRALFRHTERELTKAEYSRMIETAQTLGKQRLALLMETICATGIRVSEVKYITLEAVQAGRTDIYLKGKIRTILIPGKLCKKLRRYAQKQRIISGELFLTKSKKGLSRSQIWAEMKGLCKKAGVASSKVFPHNLRHLFAQTFYRVYKDVVRLADILGHASIETTRIYLVSTGAEHIRKIERLGLMS